jgi:hypothetical protein
MPDKQTGAQRSDGRFETSVNWEDNADVEARTLRQPNATHGAARLGLAEIQYECRRAALSAERSCLADNVHHGNLLFGDGNKARQRMIASALALSARPVKRL